MVVKLVFYICIIALLTIVAVWFASSPGDLVAVWRDYEITMSTANFVFAILLVVALLAVIIPLILGLFATPFRWWRKRQDAKYKKGLQLVTETMAAISTGDIPQAEILVKRSKKLLASQPVVPLLEAQLAGLKKDENLLQQSFQSMLEFSETKALGSKSLAEFHMRKGEVIPAISHAEQAMGLEPKNSQSLRTTLALYIKSEQFDRANDLISQGRKRKTLSKQDVKGLQALIFYLKAQKASAIHDDDAARAYIMQAYQLTPNRAVIFNKAIDCNNTDQHIKQALKILKRSWELHFTPSLVAQAQDLVLDNAAKRKLFKKLIGTSIKGKPYLAIMLAELALGNLDEYEAYAWLEKYNQWTTEDIDLPTKPNKHAHISVETELKAIVEQCTSKFPSATYECQECGANYADWKAVCDSCNSVNSILTI